jgi:hypothetical protein
MASYLPNITDHIPQLPLYQPNLGFFQQMLQRRTAMYQQGAAQVRSAYDSVLNAPLTDEGNIAARNEYIKQAQEKLKNISATDLSIPGNVEAANNVFSPFWEDEAMLMDTAMTRQAQSEVQKALAARDSSDEKIRATYSPIIVDDIMRGLSPLRTANRDLNKYKQAEVRKFVPFVDGYKTWDDILSKIPKENLGYEYVDGEYKITETGGKRLEAQLKVLASGAVTQQMRDMFKVIGRNNYEIRLDNFKQNNPHIPEEHLQKMYAREFLNEQRGNIKKDLDNTELISKGYQKELDDLLQYAKKAGYATPQQAAEITRLQGILTNTNAYLTAQQEAYDKIKDDNSVGAQDILSTISSRGSQYFAQREMSNNINNWASSRSAVTSRKVDMNPVWKEKLLEADRRADNYREDQRLALDIQKEQNAEYDREWQRQHPKTNGKKNYRINPDTGLIEEIVDTPAMEGQYLGPGATSISTEENAKALWDRQQEERFKNYTNLYLSTGNGGIGDLIASQMGDREAVNKYFSQFVNNTPSSSYNIRDQKDVPEYEKKVRDWLLAQPGVSVKRINGPGTLMDAISQYASAYFKNKRDTGTMSQKDVTYLSNLNQAEKYKNEYIRGKEEESKVISDVVSQDSNFGKYTVSEGNTSRLITAADLAKDLKPVTVSFNEDGKRVEKTFTPIELAEAWLSGKVSDEGHALHIGDKTYSLTKEQIELNKSNLKDKSSRYYTFGDVNRKYNPTYKAQFVANDNFRSDLEKINKSLVPNIQTLQKETGQMGHTFFYPIEQGEKNTPSVGVKIANELSNPINRNTLNTIYVNDEVIDDSDFITDLTKMLSQRDDAMSKVFSGLTYNTLGQVVLTVVPSTETKNLKIGDKKLADIKSIRIDLSNNVTSPILQSIKINSNITPLDGLLQGQSIHATDFEKEFGMDYSLYPNNTGTEVRYERRFKMYNIDTKQYEDVPAEAVIFDLSGPNAKSIHDIYELIEKDKAYYMEVSRQKFQAKEVSDQVNKNTGVVPNGMIPYNDLSK